MVTPQRRTQPSPNRNSLRNKKRIVRRAYLLARAPPRIQAEVRQRPARRTRLTVRTLRTHRRRQFYRSSLRRTITDGYLKELAYQGSRTPPEPTGCNKQLPEIHRSRQRNYTDVRKRVPRQRRPAQLDHMKYPLRLPSTTRNGVTLSTVGNLPELPLNR